MLINYRNRPSILLLMDYTRKLQINGNKYFIINYVVFGCYVIKPHSVTMDKERPTHIYHDQNLYQPASFYSRGVKNFGFILAITTECMQKGKYIFTKETKENFRKIKRKCYTAHRLLQNFKIYFQVYYCYSTVLVASKKWEHYVEHQVKQLQK